MAEDLLISVHYVVTCYGKIIAVKLWGWQTVCSFFASVSSRYLSCSGGELRLNSTKRNVTPRVAALS